MHGRRRRRSEPSCCATWRKTPPTGSQGVHRCLVCSRDSTDGLAASCSALPRPASGGMVRDARVHGARQRDSAPPCVPVCRSACLPTSCSSVASVLRICCLHAAYVLPECSLAVVCSRAADQAALIQLRPALRPCNPRAPFTPVAVPACAQYLLLPRAVGPNPPTPSWAAVQCGAFRMPRARRAPTTPCVHQQRRCKPSRAWPPKHRPPRTPTATPATAQPRPPRRLLLRQSPATAPRATEATVATPLLVSARRRGGLSPRRPAARS